MPVPYFFKHIQFLADLHTTVLKSQVADCLADLLSKCLCLACSRIDITLHTSSLSISTFISCSRVEVNGNIQIYCMGIAFRNDLFQHIGLPGTVIDRTVINGMAKLPKLTDHLILYSSGLG